MIAENTGQPLLSPILVHVDIDNATVECKRQFINVSLTVKSLTACCL
jgi:hypothetical protein